MTNQRVCSLLTSLQRDRYFLITLIRSRLYLTLHFLNSLNIRKKTMLMDVKESPFNSIWWRQLWLIKTLRIILHLVITSVLVKIVFTTLFKVISLLLTRMVRFSLKEKIRSSFLQMEMVVFMILFNLLVF